MTNPLPEDEQSSPASADSSEPNNLNLNNSGRTIPIKLGVFLFFSTMGFAFCCAKYAPETPSIIVSALVAAALAFAAYGILGLVGKADIARDGLVLTGSAALLLIFIAYIDPGVARDMASTREKRATPTLRGGFHGLTGTERGSIIHFGSDVYLATKPLDPSRGQFGYLWLLPSDKELDGETIRFSVAAGKAECESTGGCIDRDFPVTVTKDFYGKDLDVEYDRTHNRLIVRGVGQERIVDALDDTGIILGTRSQKPANWLARLLPTVYAAKQVGVEQLVEWLESDDPKVRYLARGELAKAGQGAVPILEEIVIDTGSPYRVLLGALVALNSSAAVGPGLLSVQTGDSLKELATNHSDRAVRKQAKALLATVRSHNPAQGVEIQAENVAWEIRDRWWKWKLFVGVPDTLTLDRIQHVRYKLHPTFPNPEVTILESGAAPERAFQLLGYGWGTFEVPIEVVFKSGERMRLSHTLRFRNASPCDAREFASFGLEEERIIPVTFGGLKGKGFSAYVGNVSEDRDDQFGLYVLSLSKNDEWTAISTLSESDLPERARKLGSRYWKGDGHGEIGDEVIFSDGAHRYSLSITKIEDFGFFSLRTDRVQLRICELSGGTGTASTSIKPVGSG